MEVPQGMEEGAVLAQIEVVINRIAPKYTFYGYEIGDIKSEAFIICMDALTRYKPPRPLENFLSVHLSNRLKNFVRDNHFSPEEERKGAIIRPAQLDHEHTIVDLESLVSMRDEILDYSAITTLIDLKLPANMRLDYIKLTTDVFMPRRRKEDVLQCIYDILEENGYAIIKEG